LDVDDKDLRRSRAAAINIIPTTTGAMKVAGKVIPELRGKLEGMALRVPVPKVSIVDLVFKTKKSLSIETINDAFLKAAQSSMKNIMKFTIEPLVSCDFNNDNHSVTIDSLLTTVTGQNLGKAFGWYDNEWGYSCRLRDFLMKTS
jgi:glyceraldehyde 3-phosphate dehydrogenase